MQLLGNNEKELGEKDNEYMDVKNSLNHDVPDIESMCNCSDKLFGTTEDTVTCDRWQSTALMRGMNSKFIL